MYQKFKMKKKNIHNLFVADWWEKKFILSVPLVVCDVADAATRLYVDCHSQHLHLNLLLSGYFFKLKKKRCEYFSLICNRLFTDNLWLWVVTRWQCTGDRKPRWLCQILADCFWEKWRRSSVCSTINPNNHFISPLFLQLFTQVRTPRWQTSFSNSVPGSPKSNTAKVFVIMI